MSELAKTYDPVGTEARWQQAWEDQGAFHPDPKAPGDPFSVVIPPPNVTGSLHMGHAFNTALIDTIVRYQRLAGKNVLCLPGTDHASIAVQTILEKQLKQEGKTRHDLGRESFLERACNGRPKAVAASSISCAGSAIRWTGVGSASPWMKASARPSEKPLSVCMSRV